MLDFEKTIKPSLDRLRLQILKNLPTKKLDNQVVNEVKEFVARMYVPYWFSIFEHGRGKRKSKEPAGLEKIIFAWMAKRGMFKSSTIEGKQRESKQMTWYINQHGTKQFINKQFKDVYSSLVMDFEKDVLKLMSGEAYKFISTSLDTVTKDLKWAEPKT